MDRLDPTKKQEHEGVHVQAKQKQEYKFLGSTKRPHAGMKLFALDAEKGEVYEVSMKAETLVDLTTTRERAKFKAYINPDHHMTWAINKKNATRKFKKIRYRV